MRTWGRIQVDSQVPLTWGGPGYFGGPGVAGGTTKTLQWVEVQTDAQGSNDYVYVTALIQCLKLSIGESPFWADWGIPAKRAVVQQVFPDYYVNLMQQRFAQYFASLQIVKQDSRTPTYNVTIITHQGVKLPTIYVGIPV